MQPVATLLIPNRLFLRKSLPYCAGCNSVFKHSALANLCLKNGAVLTEMDSVEKRLTRRRVSNLHKVKRGGSRTKLEKDTSHFMAFEGEIQQTTRGCSRHTKFYSAVYVLNNYNNFITW